MSRLGFLPKSLLIAGLCYIMLLEQLEKRKVKILEIGVWRGDFAKEILVRYHHIIAEYVMIEPAEKITGSMTPELKQRLQEFPVQFPGINFRHFNELSVEASSLFPDEYFD